MKDYVEEVFKCPKCGEREVDKLEHIDFDMDKGEDLLKCLTCGKEYSV